MKARYVCDVCGREDVTGRDWRPGRWQWCERVSPRAPLVLFVVCSDECKSRL